MATKELLSLLALRTYDADPDTNRTGTIGWTERPWIRDGDSPLTGFSAGAYRLGSDVVIAYTGTNEKEKGKGARLELRVGADGTAI